MNPADLPGEPPALVITLDASEPHGDRWCPACKAFTGFTIDLLALSPDGVRVVGSVHGCEICDDPDTPEGTRG